MLAEIYKLWPLGKQTKKIVTDYMNKGVEICGRLFRKSVRHTYKYVFLLNSQP